MKYFTAELWASWGDPDYEPPPPEKDPFVLYRAELETLRHRLPSDVFEFFADADVHDGELLDFSVVDGSRPAPLDEPARRWVSTQDYPVSATLRVLDAADALVWTLSYSHVRKLTVGFSGDEPWQGGGFHDWGYHELSYAGDNFFGHEILFASGSTILTEFKAVDVRSESARKQSAE